MVFFICEVGEAFEGLEVGTLMSMPQRKYGQVTQQVSKPQWWMDVL